MSSSKNKQSKTQTFEFDEDLLIEVLSIQSKSKNDKLIMDYLKDKTKQYTQEFDKYGNLYVTKGTAKLYPCLVSHVDRVHEIVKDRKVYKHGDILFAFSADKGEQVGVGGDDGVGVALCLNMLQDFDNCKVVFFRDEEIGCHGSRQANLEFFRDCMVVGQADRRGNKDFVTTACGTPLSSKEFQDDIKKVLEAHQYEFSTGMMTDVMTLKEKGLDVCCWNMS